MKVAAILIVCVCFFAVAYAQYYPQGVYVDPVPQTVIVGEPEQPKNMFGLPSVGAGLANIGETIANWGAGVLDTAGRILKK